MWPLLLEWFHPSCRCRDRLEAGLGPFQNLPCPAPTAALNRHARFGSGKLKRDLWLRYAHDLMQVSSFLSARKLCCFLDLPSQSVMC